VERLPARKDSTDGGRRLAEEPADGSEVKTHIRSVMHLLFECATRWELFNEQRNPIALVRVKGRAESAGNGPSF
jgi:hypothetical protein